MAYPPCPTPDLDDDARCGPTFQVACPAHGEPRPGAPTLIGAECCCGCFDLVIDPETSDFRTDRGIEHHVLLGLAIRGRAEVGDPINPRCNDRGGWWADSFRDHKSGSRLWTLEWAPVNDQTRLKIAELISVALSHLVAAGVVDRIEPVVVLDPDSSEIRVEHLNIYKPGGDRPASVDLRCLWP